MTTTNILWASTLLFLLIQSPGYAKVYKWVDENGQVNFGDRPESSDAESVNIRTNETTTPRAIKKPESDPKDKNNNPAADAGKPAEAPLVPEKLSAKEKTKLCNEAKSDYAAISSRGRMREKNAKGEYIYLPDDQRQQRLDAASKKQREYCR